MKIKSSNILLEEKPNYDKICQGIAKAETSSCTTGTAKTSKNCHGIMTWDKEKNRFPRKFKTFQDSHNACVSLWKKSYKVVPTIKEAEVWTGKDKSKVWLEHVLSFYYQ